MNNNDNDNMIAFFAVVIFLVAFGPGLLASFIPEVRTALLDARILVDENVVLPLADGIGLDIARAVILCGILLAVLVTVALVIRRFRARNEAKAATR